jgi:hypothetical protein
VFQEAGFEKAAADFRGGFLYASGEDHLAIVNRGGKVV